MDSMNNRATREYAPGEGPTEAEGFGADPVTAGFGGSTAAEWVPEGPGSVRRMDNSGLGPMQSSDSASTGVSQGASASSGAGSATGSSTTKPTKPTKSKKQSGGVAQQAEEKTDAGMQKSAEGLKKAADMTRSMTEDRSGPVGTIGSQAADVIEKGAGYLEQGDTERMIQDLEAMVRRRPMESLLIAAGAGFLLSKAMR
jgi:hypothetical protein